MQWQSPSNLLSFAIASVVVMIGYLEPHFLNLMQFQLFVEIDRAKVLIGTNPELVKQHER